jgi:hypothetical protein
MNRPPVVALAAALLAAACGDASTLPSTAADDGGADTLDDGGVPPATDGGATTAEGGAATTAGVACGYAYSGYNGSASVKATSTVTWTCTATTRSVSSNGIPDHDVGTFPNPSCPNTIAAQTVSATMTLSPVNTGTPSTLGPGGVGYALNGVKLDPGTAGTCTGADAGTSCSLAGGGGAWNIEALGQSSFNFGVDGSNAHVQPGGAYHYHGMPEAILTRLGKGSAPTLVGYALDGFPVYARYGHATPMDGASAIVVMKGSYAVKATPDPGRPAVSTYPMGAFAEDYEYVAGSGDLDECNGRTDVTPEFPAGIYHYYITDTYPFIQRCVKGTAGTRGSDGGATGGPPAADGGASCASSPCAASQVCCPAGQPCAGTCVPDCRLGSGCPSGLTCDTSTGICKP